MRFLVLHGPNLNLLGTREPQWYGRQTLDEINHEIARAASRLSLQLRCFQSNHEGELVDQLHKSAQDCEGLILNPAGLTHTSVVIRDAVIATGLPAVEVHLSNPHKREPFRHVSLMSDVVVGVISGFGPIGYVLAVEALHRHISERS